MGENGRVKGWIDEVIRATKDAESPERFFYWSAIAAISAVVKKSVYLPKGGLYKLYPNLYILLMARSGLRKGFPVTVAKNIVEEVNNTRVVSGRNTIQATIRTLSKAYTMESGEVVKNAEGFLVSGEFSSFLVHDPEALTILTDLYDTHAHEKEWVNTLKTVPIDKLLAPYLTLLGATNEDHFVEAVPKKDVKGGFIARTVIVYEEHKRHADDLLDERPLIDYKVLSCYLREMSKISGKFVIDPEARSMFKEWYDPFAMKDHHDSTGTLERVNDTILKVAMCLSLSESFDLIIKPNQMQEAMDVCLATVVGVRHVSSGMGENPMGQRTKMVIDKIDRKYPEWMSRKSLLSAGWGDYDAIDLDRIIETLTQAGGIEARRTGQTIEYRMRQQAHEQLNRFQREIQ